MITGSSRLSTSTNSQDVHHQRMTRETRKLSHKKSSEPVEKRRRFLGNLLFKTDF